jgi:peptidoglycan/LPS O-acetylase OafA/YrhL
MNSPSISPTTPRAAAVTVADRLVASRYASSGFDYLRLGLAFAVVAYHCAIITGGMPTFYFWNEYGWAIGWIVPSFFIFSGFLVTGSLARKGNVLEFLALRAIRITPALWVVILCTLFIVGPLVTALSMAEYFSDKMTWSYLINLLGGQRWQLPGVFDDNPMVHVNLSIWTIHWEIIGYLILSVLTMVGAAKHRMLLLGLYIVALVVSTLVAYLLPTLELPGAVLLMSFFSGVIFYAFRDKIIMDWRLCALAVACSFLLLHETRNYVVAALTLTYAVVYLGTLNPPKKTFLLRGDYSFAVYLVHYLVAQLYVHLFPHYRNWPAAMVWTLSISLAYAHWSWYRVEKPIQDKRRLIVDRLAGFYTAAFGVLRFTPR